MQKNFNFFYAFLLALLGFGVTLMAEDITLTTYYPAPYGAYDELTTTGNTYLATTSGNVGIGTTTPGTYKLNVTGTVNATAYSVGTTAGAVTTTITYVKTVNFPAQTVTTGTITVVNGIVTVIN
ncbi:MAG: hypothetical protein KKB22_02735 [Candidatus Omnitrophica bacterium]|nr:hypothetical protein [Candidatus Omnitrophota bacterium]